MTVKIQVHLTTLYMIHDTSVPHMAAYKNVAVIGPHWVKKQTPA